MSALELHSPQAIISPGLGRFRLVDRHPSVRARRSRRRGANPFRAALLYTGLPALLLVAYVSVWATAFCGGYQEQRIVREIQRLHIDNQTLQAQAQGLRSQARIFHRATELGMQEPQQIEIVKVPALHSDP